MNLTYSQLLRGNRDFRNLFAGQLISELGNWFNYIAGLGLIRLVSGASPEAAGILLLCRTLPWSVLMPFAGTLADRFSRRQIMIWTDVVRGFLALVFLLVDSRDDMWIAYSGAVVLSTASAFFDGAKNAAIPNIAGRDGLLSGTALMFSSRFLLMAIGSALGGIASAYFGYDVAFVINALSFFASAVSISLVSEEAMREDETAKREKESFMAELKEGMRYTVTNRFALTILLMNIIWATGGGATFLAFEGLATKVFGGLGQNADFIVAVLMSSNGVGLTIGMILAHRVGSFVERRRIERSFIGWALLAHGVLFALAGIMPTVWLAALFVVFSRTVVGAEYAVQETIFQRGLPDHIRGRITTLDRGAEITIFSFSSYLAGLSLNYVSAQLLTIVSGLLAGSSGLIWFLRQKEEIRLAEPDETRVKP
ncbi:MAG: MFS transporter [Acidobacteria bacterium]|nr:MFS transporter [Acidobacteriota bacterium]MBK8150189.1 MFS transporter [Acidobacteriota bacterium]